MERVSVFVDRLVSFSSSSSSAKGHIGLMANLSEKGYATLHPPAVGMSV